MSLRTTQRTRAASPDLHRTRQVVESAIDLSKQEKRGTWAAIIQRRLGRVERWDDPCRTDDDLYAAEP